MLSRVFVGVALVAQHVLQHVGQHDVEVVGVEMRGVVRGEERPMHPSLPPRASRRHSASRAAACSMRCVQQKGMHILPTGEGFFSVLHIEIG